MKTYICQSCEKENNFKGYSYTNKYCNNRCQKDYESKERIKQWLEEGKDWGKQIPFWIKAPNGYLAQTNGYCCEVCKITEHNGKTIVLECDHIDGNPNNNKPENLRLICPNCHSQTASFKGANRGNGRQNRYN